MVRMAGMDSLSLKLLMILVAFAMVPMLAIGILSLSEMNKASLDVQNNISSLSTSLNRSALTVAPDDADQMQLAIAKAGQYNEFFARIASENELIASYASMGDQNDSCSTPPPGIWIAPSSSNQSASGERDATIRSLCAPAKIMQNLLRAEPSLSLSYIGTEDGVLVTWPYDNATLSNAAPFGYKDMPYYSLAKAQKKTIWSEPYANSGDKMAITVTTPIYRRDQFVGIAGMDVSLQSILKDMTTISGRGYPFLLDGEGKIVFGPGARPEGAAKELFASDNLSEQANPDARKLSLSMTRGKHGSMVIGLKDSDVYVAFSPIAEVGWSFGIAYPAEEMSLPARFIDAGIKDVAKGATQGLNDAIAKTTQYALIIFALTSAVVIAFGMLLGRRIRAQIVSITDAAERISRGELDVQVKTSGELEPVGEAINRMALGLKGYSTRLEGEAAKRGGTGKETAFLKGVKRNLVPAEIPEAEGYQIKALYRPSEKDGFDLYDIVEADGRVAFAMAGVGGDGIQAAMLAIMSRTLIRASRDKLNPALAIQELNMQINQHARGLNLACFYALLDPVNHTLEYVNAGFNPPFIVDPGGMVDTLGGGGIALGMLDRMELKGERIPIQPGDVMVMYSNGVVEAENGNKRPFGVERLINLIISNREHSASDILSIIEAELDGFSKNQTAQSDVTLVIIKRS
ncbi:MAG: HAMP domain-containing protein [Methanothrix sp.]|nr:MAG: HAMP domain-containing protein [Methanothrix sp.]